MKLKDLFKSTKIVQSSSLQDMAREVESQEYIESFSKDRQRFMPNVDYSDPAAFAFYGSAEKYYTDSFNRIRNTYPYDGSEKEKYDWLNESTFIDMYIFDTRYPRYNGYVNLGYPSWGTLSGSLIGGYGKSNSDVYIKTFGGPNKSDLATLKKQYSDANKYDTSKSRESNLQFKLESGVTIEMWLKKSAFTTAKTEKEVLFDLWNGEASGSAQYGRLRLELTGASSGSPFLLTALSGTRGTQHRAIGQNLTTASIADWTHVALSMKNSGTAIETNLYINGALNRQESISGTSLGNVTGSLISYIGALQTAPSGASTVQTGAGKFSGSMDEFRYWKTERTSKQIGRHYWTHVGGGTNTDDANTDLGVYYKFNEGITTSASYDSVILDYSGRVSNGTWTGYQSGARSTDSAIVLSNASTKEYKDPTIYSSHPTYKLVLKELENSGSVHDTQNNSALYHTLPGWILEEDDTKTGNLKNLTQIMGSYFDNLHLHIQELGSLKDVYSHFQSDIVEKQDRYDISVTSASGSVKPLPFADRLLTNAGFVAPELFADATVLESLATRSEDEHYEMKLHNVKNQIYQNVYSCLSNIYKQKGTNSSFRNILHSFGVDEDIVKINFYGDNVDFEIADRYKVKASRQRFVDFNSPDRFSSTVYQYASGSNSAGFISGTAGNFEKFIPVTFEVQTVLPNKLPWNRPYGFNTSFTTSSIVGIHEANPATPSNYAIPGTDKSGLDIYSVRDETESKRVQFHLSSSALGVHLSSSLYDEQYMNNEWLFAFRMKNNKAPSTDLVLSSSLNSNYLFEFIGYNTFDNTILNSFNLTATVSSASAHSFLNSSKRIYAGSKRQNFTGSVQLSSDHKIGFLRYWMNYLDDDTLKAHSYDSSNYGAASPYRSAYLMEDSLNDIKVPEIDTLLLSWDFETLSKSDASGRFTVLDTTSGSGTQRYNSTFESIKRKFYHGRGDFFMANDEKAIDIDYMNTAQSTYPEILQGSDMIEIRTQDDVKFTKNTLPQDYYIAFEKSMAQTVSEEMIKYMASVKDFNNLIGRPVNRYRMEYKDLSKLRQLFFEKIRNEPDLDKYIDYYKWLDDALGEMLVALVPASLKHSDGINNVIENYIFARDKYFNKYPTIEFKSPTPEGGMNTINRHLYPWKSGHAPVGGTPESKNCYWWLERAERDRPLLSGSNSGSNNTRVKVFQSRNSVLNRTFTTAQHFAVDRGRHIHAGTNYEDNKKRDYVWSATKEVSETPLRYGAFGGFPLRYILTNSDMLMALKDCTDERPAHEKIKRAFFAIDGFQAFEHSDLNGSQDGVHKGGMVMPFNIMSSSVTSGYAGDLNGSGNIGNIDLTNVHSDTTDNTNVVPMQGPFAERWVGGHQHRHAPVNRGADTQANRPEGYKILVGNILDESGSIGVVGADYPYPYSSMADAPHFRTDQAKARYYREERAKRPMNIRNIKTSGSTQGNYSKNYQFVHSFGRSQQRLWMREQAVTTQRHNALNKTLPATTQEASLIARSSGSAGNTMSNFHNSSLYLGGVKTSTNNLVNTSTDSVLVSKFSAPGSFETMSDIFLDMTGREKSVYSALPFRNLSVRGTRYKGQGASQGDGWGESNTMRIYDIHGNRFSLFTHLTRVSLFGGIDRFYGAGSGKPSFHKINRNRKWDFSEQSYDNDNFWIQHQIPQSDYQYQWVKLSHPSTLATSSMAGHLLSQFTEPSGTSARYPHENVNYIVPSQSVINRRRDSMTTYGYPSWEQIRNTDTNLNNRLRKSYGYNISVESGLASGIRPFPSGNLMDTASTPEESRVVSNVPNSVEVTFRNSKFNFIYPYVNMRYHFMNKYFYQINKNPKFNETMYENFYAFYSSDDNKTEPHIGFSVIKHNIRQNIFPQYIKHTKFNVRHRHFYISHFWTDGENNLYNKNISETGSYNRLYEQGRRENNVTASLWKTENLNTQTRINIQASPPIMTNLIPSQSIWSMDSRTNFKTSNPQTAASNSAGAPGVLQNQDHHFHNGTSRRILVVSGTAATGSFRMDVPTNFGTFSSGSFTVVGMVPTGNKATGSFEITGANVQGTSGTGTFKVIPAATSPISASYQFRVKGREVPGTISNARFEVSGAQFIGARADEQFNFLTPATPNRKAYIVTRVAYQTAKHEDSIRIDKAGSSGHKYQINSMGGTLVNPTQSLVPNSHYSAVETTGSHFWQGSLQNDYVQGTGTYTYQPMIIAMDVLIPQAALQSNTNKQYLYMRYDGGNNDPCTEVYFNSGSSNNTWYDLYVKSYRKRSDGQKAYTLHKFTNVGGSDDYRSLLLFINAVPEAGPQEDKTRLYINGAQHVSMTASSYNFGGGGTLTSSSPNRHYIMGTPSAIVAGNHKWNSPVAIASMAIWATGSLTVSGGKFPSGSQADAFAQSLANHNKYEPNYNIRVGGTEYNTCQNYYYEFGNGLSGSTNDRIEYGTVVAHNVNVLMSPIGVSGGTDGDKRYASSSANTDYGHLSWYPTTGMSNTSALAGANTMHKPSRWAQPKTLQRWMEHLTSSVQGGLGGNFEVTAVHSKEIATQDLNTTWYANRTSSCATDPKALYTPASGGVASGTLIDYVTVIAKSAIASNSTAYHFLEAAVTGNQLTNQYRTFADVQSYPTSIAGTHTGSIHDNNKITINGTIVRTDHHSSSTTLTNTVPTYNNLGKSILIDSSIGATPLSTTYPIGGKLRTFPTTSTTSFWYARQPGHTGTDMIVAYKLDAGYSTTLGSLLIYFTTTRIYIRTQKTSGTYRSFRWDIADITNNGPHDAEGEYDDENFNHYAFTFSRTAFNNNNSTGITLYVNGKAVTETPVYTGSGDIVGGTTLTDISIGGAFSTSYIMHSKMSHVAIFSTILSAQEINNLYASGRSPAPITIPSLAHYWPLDTESDFPSVGGTLASVSTIKDQALLGGYASMDITVNSGSKISILQGIPADNKTQSQFGNALEAAISTAVSNFSASYLGTTNMTISADAVGTAYNVAVSEGGTIFTNVGNTTGGLNASGTVHTHNISIAGKTFHADNSNTSNTSNNYYIPITSTDSAFWNALSASIKANTQFGTINIAGSGATRTFSLTSSATGSSQNASVSVDVGNSFKVEQQGINGTNRAGAGDGHTLTLKPSSTSSEYRVFALDFNASETDNTPATYRYIQSSQSSDVNFWNALKAKIAAEGYSASYAAGSPSGGVATFTVTSYKVAAAGNAPNNNLLSTPTFAHHTGTTKFAGGTDSTGAALGDTITIGGVVHTIVHSAPSNAQQIQGSGSGLTNSAFWASVRTRISSSLSGTYSIATGSDNPRTFTVTSVATGTAQNPNIAESGDTFSNISNAAGTNEKGAENGDTITIDGSTIAINIGSGLGTGSTSAFHNALSKSIKAATEFDIITINNLGTGYHRFDLTSSVTGTANNVAFTQNTNGNRTTFKGLVGASGGTNQVGIGDLDYIQFEDSLGLNADNSYIRFKVDANGDENSTNTIKWIDISDNNGTDTQKSVAFWNELSAAIKTSTVFDTINIVTSSNVATFHVTASVTGTLFNSDITNKSNGGDGLGFTITKNTVGGTVETGARTGNTITLGGKVYTIVHSASPAERQINASGVSNQAFWNAMTASIKANSNYDLVTINTSSIPVTFTLTASTGVTDPYTGLTTATGTIHNREILSSSNNRTFTNASGMAGGTLGTFNEVKFTEVIPQPRYAYPHTLTSPGSVRAPSAKSNLGLINANYKLRSNHFNLTRSLGHITDGVFDNTSRWTTPDLSGLTPFDKDYNTWYEDIRVHNKHFSLVPEFRISSHIPSIIKSGGGDLFDYFSNNYWMELTGTSLDAGSTIATNSDPNQNKFIGEYGVTTNIKNIDTIVEDNMNENVYPIRITLSCEAIKKFLPYEGFYPQTRTVQMCEAFASSYGKHFRSQEADPENTDLEFPNNNVLAQSRPIFDAIMSPGLLYNTIKSGMAVDYPVLLNKMITGSYRDPYGGFNHMIRNEYFGDRLPFETLVSPESHLNKKFLVDTNPHPSSSFNLKTRWTGEGDENYKLMANNFFAETIEFFLQGGKTSRIVSLPDTDPDFGVVIQDHAGNIPIYRAMFRVYKSKKTHPYLELSGAVDVISSSTIAFDRYHGRPSGSTNYFLKDYAGYTGSALNYDVEKVNFPRPQFNPYAEVETITMYSQPNAFGPPCAGGVSVEFAGLSGSTALGGNNNNTTYMMYDSTNGYNSPFTPPYYDGEAWAIYTFAPQKPGKHSLDEIIENTTVKYLRYELNHESGSFGDRGTAGPQGFAINDNAMQVNASFDLFKQISVPPASFTRTGGTISVDLDPRKEGKAWVIQSKFETPILDFSKYLNRKYNATFESDVTTADIYTGSLSLSGTRQEPDTLSSIHASLNSVSQLSGILNPIGMWHQYGEFPLNEDKGVFMQLTDVPAKYMELGTEMTIPNPKYVVVQPTDPTCDASGIGEVYNTSSATQVSPYFSRQENRRRLEGSDEFAAIGGAIQVINADTGIIIDTELRASDLQHAFGSLPTANSGNMIGTFSVFNVFRDSTAYTVSNLKAGGFVSGTYAVRSNGSDVSAEYPKNGNVGSFQGHFAASYYHSDRPTSYAPLLIATKNLTSLRYDQGAFRNGFFEGFLKDFSIGIHYLEQSPTFGDSEMMGCVSASQGTVFAPKMYVDTLNINNNNLDISAMSTLQMNDVARAEMLGVNKIVTNTNTTKKSFKTTAAVVSLPPVSLTKKKWNLIPSPPAVQTTAPTSSYDYFEPMFVRGSIRFNQSNTTSSAANLYNVSHFASMSQYAPQNDNNIATNPSTVRWGQFMHNHTPPRSVKSLANLVGFNQEKVKMGVTAPSRVIREAVIAIPYIEEGGTRNYLNLNKSKVDQYLFEEGLIPVDRNTPAGRKLEPPVAARIEEDETENDQSPSQNSTLADASLTVGSTAVSSAIRSQIRKMQNYSFPPHLDFISNNINPVAMYIFEFKKDLDRKELNDMWQGVRSKSIESVSFDKKHITHLLEPGSLLGSLNGEGTGVDIYADPEKLKSLKWLVFKVKQKANKSYFKKMASDLGDTRFQFDQQNTTSNKTRYGYNWPYDYFSLVENAKIEVDIELRKMPSTIPPGQEFDSLDLDLDDTFGDQYFGSIEDSNAPVAVTTTPYTGVQESLLEEETAPAMVASAEYGGYASTVLGDDDGSDGETAIDGPDIGSTAQGFISESDILQDTDAFSSVLGEDDDDDNDFDGGEW